MADLSAMVGWFNGMFLLLAVKNFLRVVTASDKRENKNYFTCHLRKTLFGWNKIYKVYDHIVPTAAVPLKPNDTQHK